MDILDKKTTLVLNKNWLAVSDRTAADAICDVYSGNYFALFIKYNNTSTPEMDPLDWEDWEKLPIEDGDFYICSIRKKIKIPTVIISKNYNKIHTKRKSLSLNSIRERDKNICQYSGEEVDPENANIDHIIPVSRGGKSSWTNMVYCKKEINFFKKNRTPDEAGLKLIKTPKEPIPTIPSALIKPLVNDWKLFL